MKKRKTAEVFTATHTGWFSFCPVWINDPEGECAIVAKFGADWLFDLAVWYQHASIRFAQLFDPSYERGWAIRIYPLPEPKQMTIMVNAAKAETD